MIESIFNRAIPRYPSLKLLYFLQAAGAAPILPFLSVIMKQMGVTGGGFGFALALVGISGVVLRPFIVRLVDQYPNQRILVFRMIILGGVLGFGLIPFLPDANKVQNDPTLIIDGCDQSIKNDSIWLTIPTPIEDVCSISQFRQLRPSPVVCDVACGYEDEDIKITTSADIRLYTADIRKLIFKSPKTESYLQPNDDQNQHITFQTSIDCKTIDRKDDNLRCKVHCSDDSEVTNLLTSRELVCLFTNMRYWLLVFCWILGATLSSATGPIQDTFCHQILRSDSDIRSSKPRREDHHPETYGQQRLYASIGYGSCAFISGYVIHYVSEGHFLNNYTPCFIMMVVFWLSAAYIVGEIGITEKMDHNKSKSRKSSCVKFETNLLSMFRDIKDTLIQVIKTKDVVEFLLYVSTCGVCMGALNMHFLLLEELGQ